MTTHHPSDDAARPAGKTPPWPPIGSTADTPVGTFGGDPLYQTLDWVLRSLDDPAQSAVDWVAQEVDATRPSAVALLTDPQTPLSRIVRARSFYMALRAEGETPAERALGGRMAAAAAAAALVFHNERITTHDDEALITALRAAANGPGLPPQILELLQRAIQVLARRG